MGIEGCEVGVGRGAGVSGDCSWGEEEGVGRVGFVCGEVEVDFGSVEA